MFRYLDVFKRNIRLLCRRSTKSQKFSTRSFLFGATIIDGNKLAKQVRKEVSRNIQEWINDGHTVPHLTAVLVGNEAPSSVFIKHNMKAALDIGITADVIKIQDSTTQTELLNIITDLNETPSINGILVQLPLPKHMDERAICNTVHPDKDVAGCHISNMGGLCLDKPNLLPATAYAVWEMLRRTGIKTLGQNTVVCGRSKNFGMTVAALLHSDANCGSRTCMDATVTTCHRYTPTSNLTEFIKPADIIVVAVGSPCLVTADMIKDGAVVIDAGINRIWDKSHNHYRVVGDVDFEGVSKKASFVSPVPGGVGPMTVAMVMKNMLQATQIQDKKPRRLIN